jgi:hypothetical protein
VVESLALTLATRLKVPTLACLNHDDNVLLLWLYDRGGQESRYGSGNSFDKGERSPSEKQFAAKIREAFGTEPDEETPKGDWRMRLISTILPRSFAFVRHERILRAPGFRARQR